MPGGVHLGKIGSVSSNTELDAMATNATLESDLYFIRSLNALRKRARSMREEGLKGLLAAEYKTKEDPEKDRPDWSNPADYVERAILIDTLGESAASKPGWEEIVKDNLNRITRIPLQAFFLDVALPPQQDNKQPRQMTTTWTSKHPAASSADAVQTADQDTTIHEPDLNDHVPVLRAANVLHTLATKPQALFTEGGFSSFFRIVYELNSASAPEELVGGAGAGHRGVPQTAFITWWCVRAMRSFAETLSTIGEMTGILKDLSQPRPEGIPGTWWENHIVTRRAVASVTLAKHQSRMPIDIKELLEALQPNDEMRTRELNPDVKDAIDSIRTAFKVQMGKAREHLAKLCQPQDHSSPFAHARQVVSDLKHEFTVLETSYEREVPLVWEEIAKYWDVIDASWKKMYVRVLGVLSPVKKYFRHVLDHELAAGTVHPQQIPDAAELLFAADGLAQLGGDNQSLTAALYRVLFLLSPDGRVPSHKPFDVKGKGYVLHVAGAEVIRCLADLARRLKVTVEPENVEKLLRHFDETWQEKLKGWRHERDDSQGDCQWWLSGLCVQALGALVRMLDVEINQAVLKHFSSRQPDDVKLTLDKLFYPDYGLTAAGLRKLSISVELQRMRAHVLGVKLKGKVWEERLHTAILFGPPGTGKTTLVEALANTASVPLVEVTPSDIVLAGTEKMEARARAAFESLSMLTDVIILFDEFDSILWSRDARSHHEGLLKFLTPGMLPKLKNLNESAKDQRIAFILSTNYIGGLDDAAIREGRFNDKFGIYPPDALSRDGQLRSIIARQVEKTDLNDADREKKKKEIEEIIKENEELIKEVVNATAGGAMDRLGKPGWFTSSEKLKDGTPLSYVLKTKTGKEAKPDWGKPEAELPTDPSVLYKETLAGKLPNRFAFQEWKEWYFVKLMDGAYQKGVDLKVWVETALQNREALRELLRKAPDSTRGGEAVLAEKSAGLVSPPADMSATEAAVGMQIPREECKMWEKRLSEILPF